MPEDVRKHLIPPATGSPPRRQVFDELSLSVVDIVTVANTTARLQLATALTAAGVGPTASRAIYVHRLDAPAGYEVEWCVDPAGSVWTPLGQPHGALVQIGNGGVPSGTQITLGPAAALTEGSPGFVRSGAGIQVPSDGWYELDFYQEISGAVFTSGRSFVEFTLSAAPKSGPTDVAGYRVNLYPENSGVGHTALRLAAGTSVGLNAYQTSGTTRAYDGFLSVIRRAEPYGW